MDYQQTTGFILAAQYSTKTNASFKNPLLEGVQGGLSATRESMPWGHGRRVPTFRPSFSFDVIIFSLYSSDSFGLRF
ncbi:MAG: hypothetical protein AABZ13_03230, partial [Planctomycetota bacterium]